MRHLSLSLLLSTLPALALAETWTTPSRPRRTVALQAGPALTYTEGFQGTQLRRGLSGLLELGMSVPMGYEEDELFLLARAGRGAPGINLSAHVGWRSVFEGTDVWRSYAELGAGVHLRPDFWVGPRLGLGVRRTLSERFSLYGGLGTQLGFGSGLRLDVELCTGVRWGL
ncbi:hypothetical protein F0U60_30210 [Archangium minus]|uniref:Outer membrane protein beta-barrel domain-containing protein n=1 Tax=Archangium minus TaxID=83450 RepID=A0ABY9WXS2_9BACT|nr:hypothetical protein F0U60_30210 [Archangium minus]